MAEEPNEYTWQHDILIEYPIGSTPGTGTLYRPTWLGGAGPVTVAPGSGFVYSDPIAGLTIPATAAYNIWHWKKCLDFAPPVATFTVSGGAITSTTIADGGKGLNAAKVNNGSATTPNLTASAAAGQGGTVGTLTPTVVGGVLTGLAVASAGTGQTDGTYPVTFAGGVNYSLGPSLTGTSAVNRAKDLADFAAAGVTPVAPTNIGGGAMMPMGLLGVLTTAAPTVAAASDSIFDGSYSTIQTSGNAGYFEEGLGMQFGRIEVGRGGASAYQLVNRRGRNELFLRATRFINDLCDNDIWGQGQTLAQVQAAVTALHAPFLDAGIPCFQTTCLPRTNSSDGWSTAVNQTTISTTQLAVYQGFNSWLRNGGLAGVTIVDIDALLASAPNSGLWGVSRDATYKTGYGGAAQPGAISGGVWTGYNLKAGGSGYPASATIPCTTWYPPGAVGSGLVVTAQTNGSGVITGFTVVNGGTGHNGNNLVQPRVLIPGVLTGGDGIHPSEYGHLLANVAGLISPALFA